MALFAHRSNGSLIRFIREAKIILCVIDEGFVCGKWIDGIGCGVTHDRCDIGF